MPQRSNRDPRLDENLRHRLISQNRSSTPFRSERCRELRFELSDGCVGVGKILELIFRRFLVLLFGDDDVREDGVLSSCRDDTRDLRDELLGVLALLDTLSSPVALRR